MTDLTTETTRQPSKIKKTVFALLLGGVAGFAATFLFLRFADSGAVGELGTSREIASLVGLVYLVGAAAVLAGVLAPKAGANFLNVEDAEELREQKVMLGSGGIAMIAAGAALIVAALAAPVGPIAGGMALALFVALIALAVFASYVSQKRQDELMRAMGQQNGATAFYLLFFVGGGWALAAHCGFVSAPAPLDWLTMMWGLGLIAAFVTTIQRGMFMMR